MRYLVVAPLIVAGLLLGLWLFAGQLAPSGFNWSIGFGVLWFVVAWLVIRVGARRLPQWRRVAQLALGLTGAVVLALFAWTSLRDVTVNDEIALGARASQLPPTNESARRAAEALGNWTGGDAPPAPPPEAGTGSDAAAEGARGTEPNGNIELAAGEFETQAHSSSGRTAVVLLENGSRVLTFENLDTDNGPDLRVYLVNGPAENDNLGDFIDLGGLKGNKGNQQYEIPDDIDVGGFTTVAIWCRAFSVGFAKAELIPS